LGKYFQFYSANLLFAAIEFLIFAVVKLLNS
jgi:hypothetical protein